MVSREALKMRRHCPCNLLRLFHLEKMTDDLGVVCSLTGQSLDRVSLRNYLRFVHHLNLLGGLGNACGRARRGRHCAIHQLRPRVEEMVKLRLQWAEVRPRSDRIGPNPCDLPNVDLAIGDNVGTSRCKVPKYPIANPVRRLPNVDGDAV